MSKKGKAGGKPLPERSSAPTATNAGRNETSGNKKKYPKDIFFLINKTNTRIITDNIEGHLTR